MLLKCILTTLTSFLGQTIKRLLICKRVTLAEVISGDPGPAPRSATEYISGRS